MNFTKFMILMLAWLGYRLQSLRVQVQMHPVRAIKPWRFCVSSIEKQFCGSITDVTNRLLRFLQSNGITEGFSNRKERISLRAYGIPNFNNCRMRILALCGRNGVRLYLIYLSLFPNNRE